MYRRFGKRAFDVVLATLALLLLWPVIAAAMAAVRLKLGSPVLFKQRRPGRHGRPFTLVKLRTMRDAVDEDGKPLPDGERITELGRWLRRLSVDELPELINVLRGEMSLVGPRPLLMEYLPLYSPRQARRHEAAPGITGWAQVNGRNASSWEDRFAFDLWYVDRVGLALDLKTLALTVVRVAQRRGVAAAGHATMPAFTGSRAEAPWA